MAIEPCLNEQCRSPGACADWGYCRERNLSKPTGMEWRDWEEHCREEASYRKSPPLNDTPPAGVE